MYRVFISDLHLFPNCCSNSKILIRYLKENHNVIDELYILGDLFNYWVGDDIHMNEYHDIINAIAYFNKDKQRTFLLYGNRDFLFGNEFFEKSKIVLIDDPFFIDLNDKKAILTHGDLLFDKSFTYQIYRRLGFLWVIWCILMIFFD